ncbi:MAG TPA: succinylglutamate desuccinylase/aspartoacylase family protein [Terrimesophilobacter sp.]|nr:succinylglutamate desuccinylase/aspartoacylase family protein [Terrimesophilobacter sp.]
MPKATFEWLPVTTRSSGEKLSIALHTLEGTTAGPTLGLFSTSHGDEAYAVLVIREVLKRVDPTKLKGKILAMPLGNPIAFESFTRTTGQGMNTDMNNMNRVFPGDAGGWLTQQMAHTISSRFVANIDYLLDFHCGGVESGIDYVLTHAGGNDTHEQSRHLSRVYGTEILFEHAKAVHSGTLTDLAIERGKPSVVVEVGGSVSANDPTYLEKCVQGVFNVMIELGMWQGQKVLPKKQYLMRRRVLVRPTNGGMFQPEVHMDRLGKAVKGGTVLARVFNAQTFEELDVFTAPYDETIMIMMRGLLSRVNPGDYAYILGDFSSAEVIVNA